jgi:hypothetical protein
LAVDNAELYRIANLESKEWRNSDFVICVINGCLGESGSGAGRFVKESAGRTGQDSDGHFVNGSGCA